MKITVIGASAGVGLCTVQRALEGGHTVTTLSRTVDALPTSAALDPIAGSALDPADLGRALVDADAVLVTLGTGRSRSATTLYTDFARSLIDVARERSMTAPVITVTGVGAGDSAAYQRLPMRLAMRLLLAKVYADKTEMEQLLATSSLNWEIVRPARLTNGAPTTAYRVLPDYTHDMKISSVSRRDVADYLVTEAQQPANLRRYPAVTN